MTLRPEPKAEPRHCDDYIDDQTQPKCLRGFLDYARSPAHGMLRQGPKPALFADHETGRVRVVMASRFGDVGITKNLAAEYGYDHRVNVESLSNFASTATGHADDCAWHCDQHEPDCTCEYRERMS